MIDRLPVTDQDLSDLIDQRLSPDREQEVRRALEERPDLARLYERMIDQDHVLRRLGEEVLTEPVPESMLAVLRRAEGVRELQAPPEAEAQDAGAPQLPRRFLTGAVAAALAVGLVLGWFAQMALAPSDAGMFQDAVRQAALSHRMFVTAGEPQPIAGLGSGDVLPVAGLSGFGTPVRAPALIGADWVPVGLKTESGTGGNALQIAYADPSNEIVTLYVRPLSEADDVPVNQVEAEGYDVLYWIDGPLIYALVGEQEATTLVELARRVYAARASGGAWSGNATPAAAHPASAEPDADP